MVVIPTSSDWITPTPTCCFRVSKTTASNTIGGVVLTRDQRCSNLWLPISIHCGVVCGCEYLFGFLLLVRINGRIYQLRGPNWLPNSMPLNLLWTTRIFKFCYYGWSINVHATLCNSTSLVIFVLMWKGTEGQSVIACPSSSQNAQTLESNLIISESTYSWCHVLTMYLVWSNFGFPWCEHDYNTSSNAFTCASTYSNDLG
jgi:hypothetical protein